LAGIVVEDLGSRSGAYLDDLVLRGPTTVTGRSVLTLGQTKLIVERRGPVHAPPPELEGFRLTKRLGQGGAGTVYAGEVISTGRQVAVKVLLEDADEVSRRRFEQEAGIVGRLDHPAIGRVIGLRSSGGRPCLVRELVPGRSLMDRIQAEGALPWQQVVAIGARIADALAHAHGRGVIHRDVKPGNVILVDPGEAPVLIDFDLARRDYTNSMTQLTETGEGLGTISYLAPEQLRDAHSVDGRADVYGLGMTLYHALSGSLPFIEFEPEELFDALLHSGPRPLTQLVRDAPPAVMAAIRTAYAIDPGARYPSAEHMARAFGSLG
ncbi:serine/threonine protein kinase, partial [Planctomycetota bacterium]|nr:serine/threonine protein kinase [Planctomycetota bacterium]